MKAQRDDYNSKLYNKYRNMLLDLIINWTSHITL